MLQDDLSRAFVGLFGFLGPHSITTTLEEQIMILKILTHATQRENSK